MPQAATQAETTLPKAATLVLTQRHYRVWLMAILVVLVTAAIYWPATRCDFVNYDDHMYVLDNPHVTSGMTWANVQWAFRSGYATNWHPLTWLSHMLDCQMFGLKPWGHHLTSVLLHALNAGLVFALLQLLTGAPWRSLLVAVLFALHPLRVESVAWVSERKDVLSGFFGLLALLAYVRYAQGRGRKSEARNPRPEGNPKPEARSPKQEAGRLAALFPLPSPFFYLPYPIFYLLSLFFLALGLMSKPMLVTWPLVMLLLDYWPLRRMQKRMQNAECRMQNAAPPDAQHATRNRPHVSRITLLSLLVEKIPFFFLVALSSVVTFVVQKRGGAMTGVASLPLGVRVETAVLAYARYLGKLFRPVDLAVLYWHPGHWPLGEVLLAGALILCLSVVVWMLRRRAPYLLMGWLWFVGTLVPVIGLVQVGEQAMADRYTYLPCLGVLILTIWGVCELTRSWRYQAIVLAVVAGAASVFCVALTRQQLGHWQDSEALSRHALAVTENNYLAHKNPGRRPRHERPNRQGDQPIRGSPSPQPGLCPWPQQPRYRLAPEWPSGRGGPAVPGGHPTPTGRSRGPQQPRHGPCHERPE